MSLKRGTFIAMVKSWLVFIVLVQLSSGRAEASHLEGAMPSGFLQLDYGYSELSHNYGNWHDASIRSYLELTRRDHLDAELSLQQHFDDTGILYGLRYLRVLSERWYGSFHAAASDGGFFLPDYRLDISFSRKWLSRKQLITSLAYMHYRAKDGHIDHAPQLSVLYYFQQPWILEMGVRQNLSDPGAIVAWRRFISVSYGRYKQRYFVFRYDAGKEAYQLIGSDAVVSDFASSEVSLTLRQWLSDATGVNIVANYYENVSYARSGLRAGWFFEF